MLTFVTLDNKETAGSCGQRFDSGVYVFQSILLSRIFRNLSNYFLFPHSNFVFGYTTWHNTIGHKNSTDRQKKISRLMRSHSLVTSRWSNKKGLHSSIGPYTTGPPVHQLGSKPNPETSLAREGKRGFFDGDATETELRFVVRLGTRVTCHTTVSDSPIARGSSSCRLAVRQNPSQIGTGAV
jgi:hypothetical protein